MRDPIELAADNWVAAGWDESADGMALVTSVVRVQQVLVQAIDELLRPYGLTFARFEVLMLLRFSRAGALPLGKIGERLQVHRTSVTNIVDQLERSGFVRRVPHDEDRRAVLAEITPAGRRAAAAATEAMHDAEFGVTGTSRDDLEAVVAVLDGVRHRAGDF